MTKLGALLTTRPKKILHYSTRALVDLGETALAALKAAREKETDSGNRGLMDAAIREMSQ